MTRTLLLGACALFFTACTASSDDVGEAGVNDVAGVSEMVNRCPDTLILDLAGYGSDELPEFKGDHDAWHVENGLRSGVETTDSGVQYRVVQRGMENGMTPRSGETVTARYHGTKLDGTIFDSSIQRDEGFTTATTRVIPGWTEMLEDMTVCEARTIYLPAALAYGQRGAPRAGIAPGDSLIFQMQLVSVDREGVADAVGIDRN